MVVHELKTHSDVFQDVWDGKKLFEIRKNDRDFKVGDYLFLLKYNPVTHCYIERRIEAKITYIIQGRFGLPSDLCVMQIQVQLRR